VHRAEDEHAGSGLELLRDPDLGLADLVGARRRVEAGIGAQLVEAGKDRRRAVHRLVVHKQAGDRAAPLAVDFFDLVALPAGF